MIKCLCLTCPRALPTGRAASILFCLIFTVFYSSSAQIITTFAGNGIAGYSGDHGAATTAMLDSPSCVVTDFSGNVYINDQRNSCIRMVSSSGVITTIAGTGTAGYNGDTLAATASKLNISWGIAADGTGNIYVADQANHRVRKVNTIAGTIATIAGTGTYGYTGDGGPATDAEIRSPIGIALDQSGNIYFGDPDTFCIRRINASGTISRFAGNGHYGFSGDGGPALNAKFSYIWGLATDAAGNVYVCDGENNRVRKISQLGIVTTIAGTGAPGYNGDNRTATSASLYQPTSVYVSGSGEVYISDFKNNRIRKINTAGIISTIAGTGFPGFFGDNGPATSAELFQPLSVTMDANDNLYLSDLDNVRIREIIKALKFSAGHSQHLTICENTASASLDSQLAITDRNIGLGDTCFLVSGPSHGSVVVYYTTTATGSPFIPSGVSYSPAVGFYGNDSIKVCVRDGAVADTTTIYITVDEIFLSAGTITGASSVCAGSVITLTDSATGGVWSSSNANATVTPIADGCIVTGVYTGTDTIIYVVSNACGMASSEKTIVINTLPDAGMITGPPAVCRGSTIILTDLAADGIWSSTNPNASVSSGVVTGLIAGMDTILYTVTNTNCRASVAHGVRIDTFPDAGVISGPGSVCVGSQITLSDTAQGGIWSSSDTTASVNPLAPATAGMSSVTGVSKGTSTISYSISNACGTDAAILPIIVGTLPDIPALTEFEGVFYAPTGYSSYQWTLNGTSIPGAVADTYLVTGNGDYAVIVTNDYGCSTASLPQTFPGCGAGDIKVFPNPAESMVYIEWCKKVTISLFCEDGRLVKKIKNTDKIDLGELPNGVYLLSIYDGNGIYVKTKRVTKLTE